MTKRGLIDFLSVFSDDAPIMFNSFTIGDSTKLTFDNSLNLIDPDSSSEDWIDVNNKLPDNGGHVLVASKKESYSPLIDIAWYDKRQWHLLIRPDNSPHVKLWMPLPNVKI